MIKSAILTEQRSETKPLAAREIIEDYKIAIISRQCSITGRKEVLNGRAKFGIFGDGKEIAQIAYAKQFKEGDWRSGYYRDQTFLMAAGLLTPKQFFAQIYGTTENELNPGNGGRSFNNHFATPNFSKEGEWLDLTNQKNSAADLSPTASHLPRLLGLALASKLFRANPGLSKMKGISRGGNEVAFGTIGDASTSEGYFFEVINAAGVLQIPLALAVWDDGYGISVPVSVQTVKSNISEVLKGFEKTNQQNGIRIYTCNGWDYQALCKIFAQGIAECRREHVPVLFHITEVTQPLGHSTSGSHERYKSAERLEWENQHDCIKRMEDWMLENELMSRDEMEEMQKLAQEYVEKSRLEAWEDYQSDIRKQKASLLSILNDRSCVCKKEGIDKIALFTGNLKQIQQPIRKDNLSTAKKILNYICPDCPQRADLGKKLNHWIHVQQAEGFEKYSKSLYNETGSSVLHVKAVPPEYSENAPLVPGREIIRDNFDVLFAKYPLLVAFGEDVGKIGGVNQTYEGLQSKYGSNRIFDTGIREASIIGKGIGLALRGFRPIAEIQYLDYLLYGLELLSDDVATVQWRTSGNQCIPLIVSTRGHRLEGIWHSGSPLGMLINALRGMYICVPRNMTQAAGFYNTLLEGYDPALVIEPLNAYRLKEVMPDNLGEYKVPLGISEVLEEGADLTLVTYGSCVRIAHDAVLHLRDIGISVELIDVQTLIPFDLEEHILKSVQKTGRILFLDEDVPGGATAYMMHQVLEVEGAWKYLKAQPKTLTGKDHRPAYTTDGDYFSNPGVEDVMEGVIQLVMNN